MLNRTLKVITLSGIGFGRGQRSISQWFNEQMREALRGEWEDKSNDQGSIPDAITALLDRSEGTAFLIVMDELTHIVERLLGLASDKLDEEFRSLRALRVSPLVRFIYVTERYALRYAFPQDSSASSFFVSTVLPVWPLERHESEEVINRYAEALSKTHGLALPQPALDRVAALTGGVYGLIMHTIDYFAERYKKAASSVPEPSPEELLRNVTRYLMVEANISQYVYDIRETIGGLEKDLREFLMDVATKRLGDRSEKWSGMITPYVEARLKMIGLLDVNQHGFPHRLASGIVSYTALMYAVSELSAADYSLYKLLCDHQGQPMSNDALCQALLNQERIRQEQATPQSLASAVSRVRGALKKLRHGKAFTIDNEPERGYKLTFSIQLDEVADEE